MNEYILRTALPSDMADILVLQLAVFVGEQKIPADDVPLSEERLPTWWCAEVDGQLAAAVAAWEEDGVTHWGRFAVQPHLRGRHIGTALARRSLEDLFAGGADTIHLTARESTVRIFLKLGGIVTGEPEPFFEGTVTPLVLRKADYIPE